MDLTKVMIPAKKLKEILDKDLYDKLAELEKNLIDNKPA